MLPYGSTGGAGKSRRVLETWPSGAARAPGAAGAGAYPMAEVDLCRRWSYGLP
ncbi:MAG: hypothetical protein ACLUIX_08620 [Oscillospiraceae bacterium]